MTWMIYETSTNHISIIQLSLYCDNCTQSTQLYATLVYNPTLVGDPICAGWKTTHSLHGNSMALLSYIVVL